MEITSATKASGYRGMNRRDFLKLGGAGLIGASMLGAAGCGGGGGGGNGGGGDSSTSLNIGYIGDVHGGGLVAAANEQGFWEQANLDAQLSSFTDGPTQIQALGSGELDVAYIGPGALWLPASGRGTLVTLDSLSTADTIITRPGEIGSLEELRGKRVGAPEGTSGEMILLLALDRAGLTMDDIEFVSMSPDSIVTAFVSGQIDAAAPFPPGANEILRQVSEAEVLIDTGDFAPEYAFPEVWVARNELVQNEPESVKAFLRAFVLANDWRANHVDETVTLTSELAGTPERGNRFLAERTDWLTSQEIVQANDSGDTFQWMSSLQDLFLRAGVLDEESDPQDFVNTELLAEVVGESGGGTTTSG